MARKDRFINACWQEQVDCTPVWIMRQSGRYLKEYRDIRKKYSFMTMCKTPSLATTLTLLPVYKIEVDAAILFSDILIPLEAMGVEIRFIDGKGPVILNPVRKSEDLDSLRIIDAQQDVPFVIETIKLVLNKLDGEVPLIGFSGAPFTLASYLVEGGSSRHYLKIKSMMYNDPVTYETMMDKVVETIISYLNAQIKAGVQAIQIFDSWIGCFSPQDYEKYVMPYTKRVIEGLERDDVPVIHFATGSATLLEFMKKAGGEVIGIDWRINIDDAWKIIGYDKAIQGNLDPAVLFASKDEVEERVRDILMRVNNRPGHIFNLGHGVLPKTPVENVITMVRAVHKYSAR
ncbi:MAG: uroporphyrinogen decarboxylase [Candidatus Hydrothermarchaeota archaeon]